MERQFLGLINEGTYSVGVDHANGRDRSAIFVYKVDRFTLQLAQRYPLPIEDVDKVRVFTEEMLGYQDDWDLACRVLDFCEQNNCSVEAAINFFKANP